jgi:hypothetical protein
MKFHEETKEVPAVVYLKEFPTFHQTTQKVEIHKKTHKRKSQKAAVQFMNNFAFTLLVGLLKIQPKTIKRSTK